MLRRALRALPAVLLTAACTSGATPPPRAAPAECALKPGRHTLRHGGQERTYLLSLPAKGKGRWPVVLNLHGLGSNAGRQADRSRLPAAGARRGYVIVTPQMARHRMAWTLPGYYGPDDTGFLTTLLDTLVAKGCADASRQFAAGMSYGAGMSMALVCAMKGRLAAVAPVAGLNVVPPCPEAAPTTIVAFHGTGDVTVPYGGGHPFARSPSRLRTLAKLVRLASVEGAAGRWARIMGCPAPRTTKVRAGVRLRAWKDCRQGVSVRLYTIGGAGHVWPRPDGVRRVDAAGLILDAFDAVSVRRGR
ncbi:alpha/beta hydrolase family esterase [Nonomuraea sp. NPDC050790]|uniref:alpha/beta hydrolase family esterase n=1 Tax=Nonomuraea sp. NPDC050790 TaxID=3364371 RepID=UPI0037917B22